MEITEIIVPEDDNRERLDKWVNLNVPDLSRTRVQDMINEEMITVNNKGVKRNYRVTTGDQITIQVNEPEPVDVKPENIPLDIKYEDEELLVINKTRGMVVHPAPGHESGTLVNALLYYCNDLSGINGVLRPGIVHRIDMDTSGLLVVAKTDHAHHSLADQLKAKTTHRVYKAIVHGVVQHDKGTIDAPVGRDEKDRKKMAVTRKNSKEAVTHFEVEERFSDYTFVKCQLETGRTHQIRVHMAYIGHPVAGDPKYGLKKTLGISGQALHAAELGFEHPITHEFMTFTAELPRDMEEELHMLKNQG